MVLAIFIDSEKKNVTQISVENYTEVTKKLRCWCVTVVCALPNGDFIYKAHELLHHYSGMQITDHYVLGNAVVLQQEKDVIGDAKSNVQTIREKTVFFDIDACCLE